MRGRLAAILLLAAIDPASAQERGVSFVEARSDPSPLMNPVFEILVNGLVVATVEVDDPEWRSYVFEAPVTVTPGSMIQAMQVYPDCPPDAEGCPPNLYIGELTLNGERQGVSMGMTTTFQAPDGGVQSVGQASWLFMPNAMGAAFDDGEDTDRVCRGRNAVREPGLSLTASQRARLTQLPPQVREAVDVLLGVTELRNGLSQSDQTSLLAAALNALLDRDWGIRPLSASEELILISTIGQIRDADRELFEIRSLTVVHSEDDIDLFEEPEPDAPTPIEPGAEPWRGEAFEPGGRVPPPRPGPPPRNWNQMPDWTPAIAQRYRTLLEQVGVLFDQFDRHGADGYMISSSRLPPLGDGSDILDSWYTPYPDSELRESYFRRLREQCNNSRRSSLGE